MFGLTFGPQASHLKVEDFVYLSLGTNSGHDCILVDAFGSTDVG
jgi:hypothetical protein